LGSIKAKPRRRRSSPKAESKQLRGPATMAGPFTFWTFGECNFFANRWGEYLPLSADALRQRADELPAQGGSSS